MNMQTHRANASVHWYLEALGARAVVRGGRAQDRLHLGALVLQALREAPPDDISQIDGGTGESESYGSVLSRSVRCARALSSAGLGLSDVIVLMAPNHIHVTVPFLAALYTGVAIAPVDRTVTVDELEYNFSILRPKMIFCQSERAEDVQRALSRLGLKTEVVTFDIGETGDGTYDTFQQFMEKHAGNEPDDTFVWSELDPAEAAAVLVPTSGTTGRPKYAALTHANLATVTPHTWNGNWQFPGPTRLQLVPSPLQWITAIFFFIMAPVYRYPRLQTSRPLTPEHMAHLFKTYKPTLMVISPVLLGQLVSGVGQLDLSSLETLHLGGSAPPQGFIERLQAQYPRMEVRNGLGVTEASGLAFLSHGEPAPPGSCGTLLPCHQYRLIDVNTQEDITEPNVKGELWLKGPGIFKGYYRNPAATAETFAEDGWLRTGDLLYRDHRDYFYFVERIKLLIKYMNHQVSPVELEEVIRAIPGVCDVAVTGVADPSCGELPVAVVVRREGSRLTARDIKDVVAERLSDAKQLRGGVIWVQALPLTANGKMDRRALREIALANHQLHTQD